MKIVSEVKTQNQLQQAMANLILGWGNRQIGQFETAEKYLIDATKLNPKSIRSFYELGKVYQAREDTEKAIQAYRKALALFFNETERQKLPQQQQ